MAEGRVDMSKEGRSGQTRDTNSSLVVKVNQPSSAALLETVLCTDSSSVLKITQGLGIMSCCLEAQQNRAIQHG